MKTNKFDMKRIVFIIGVLIMMLKINAQEYPKVILPGDYPDPTIVRDGADYYMTHSPFFYAPGFLIWHSQDLVNWQPVCRAIPEHKGSAMAPDLIKYNGRFFLYWPAAGTNWVSYADNIRGPWSEPIDLKVGGIDPGHVVGEDGKRYLYLNDGWVIGLTGDGLATVGEKRKVYDGWGFPKQWETEGMWLESPKLIHKDGYFYMTSAQGGTAGPPTSHMVVAARSKNVLGPWENSPYNPIVRTYNANDNWWSKGHGTIIDDVNGNWWVVYHAYANNFYTLGRQTLIEPVEWTKDGWYVAKSKGTPIKPKTQIKHGLELSDDFDGSTLGLQWTFWKENGTPFVSQKDNRLTVKGKGTTPADGRLMLVTPTDKNYITQVEVSVGRNNTSGLLLYYSEKAYAGVVSDGKTFTVYKNKDEKFTLPNKIGKCFIARIHNRGNNLVISVSRDGIDWMPLIENLDVSRMHHNTHLGFYALRPALVSMGRGSAVFSRFVYRNAIPAEKDMAAYLMVSHYDPTHSVHMAISYDGYTFTALNDAKPVIAGDTIADQKGIRDPHIFRGPDGAFYMSMTDLHAFGQREGFRETKWERDEEKYGWGNNRGIVLMKSWDLINWSHKNLRLPEVSKAYEDVACVWAPQTTWDAEKQKLMLYFTMHFGRELNKLYYAYVNEAYDKLESLPELLLQYPDPKSSAIDACITKIGDKYHMFYKTNDGRTGIRLALSDRANGPYELNGRWYDTSPVACEGPNLWKRIGENKWVLMYDIYGRKKHNFGFIETSDFVHFKNLGEFNEGVMKAVNFESPKHGAIIQITKEEAERLEKHWQTKK